MNAAEKQTRGQQGGSVTEPNRAEQTLHDLLDSIPGNQDYNNLETRRDSDRRIRQDLIDAMTSAINATESALHLHADARHFDTVTALENGAQRLRYARDVIRSLSYGYTGLFSDTPVRQNVLDQLRSFDRALAGQLSAVLVQTEKLGEASLPEAETIAAGNAIAGATNVFLQKLAERNRLITTGEPVASQTVGDLLGSHPGGANLPQISPGSALSVDGSNYVADSVIEMNGPGRQTRVSRLAQQPERWLLTSTTARSQIALLLEPGVGIAGEAVNSVWAETAPATLKTVASETAESATKLSVDKAAFGTSPFRVSLDWQSLQQRLVGREVPLLSIEVFGIPPRQR